MNTLKPESAPPSLAGQPHLAGVRGWLLTVYLMILAMVIIGGVTRLTGSGLSMVEWRPLMGALPPIGEVEWLEVFAKYQQSPQYQEVNSWMTLADFKRIFFWEYLHRLFGRLIGLVFFVPWLYFVIRRRLQGRLARRAGLAFILGGAQGALGWFMVKSGLVDIPEVSHFRLAAHLSLAFFVGAYILWLLMDLRHERPTEGLIPRGLVPGFLGLLTLQIVYGAFMAGTRAGYLFQTFPDMNGSWMPPAWRSLDPLWLNLFENPVAIHGIHRWLAWLVAAAAIGLSVVALRRARSPRQRAAAWTLTGLVTVQFILGVITVVQAMPLWAAASHQGVAFLLLSAALWVAHSGRPGR